MITNFWQNREKLTWLFCVVKKMAHKPPLTLCTKVHCPVAPPNFFSIFFFHILQVWFYNQNEQNEGVSRCKIPILFLVNHPIVHVINSNQGHVLYSVKSYGGRTISYPGLSISLHPGTRLAHTGFELTTLGSWVWSSIPLRNGACFNFWSMRNPPGQWRLSWKCRSSRGNYTSRLGIFIL